MQANKLYSDDSKDPPVPGSSQHGGWCSGIRVTWEAARTIKPQKEIPDLLNSNLF